MEIHYEDMKQRNNNFENGQSSSTAKKSPKDRLQFILMIVSYTMLELRQQISSYCNERGSVILKILKIILTIPNLFCELHEDQIFKSKEVIKEKANNLKWEKDHELEKLI